MRIGSGSVGGCSAVTSHNLPAPPCLQAGVATPEAGAQQEGMAAMQYTGGTELSFGGITPAMQGGALGGGFGGFDGEAMEVA